MVEHARQLDDATQLELPPATPDIRSAERLTESPSLTLQFSMRGCDAFEMFSERLVVALAIGLDLPKFFVHPGERLPERADQGVDRGFALSEGFAARPFEGAEAFSRQS